MFGRHLTPFGFISPVLEPDFHLGLGEFQSPRQIGPLRTRKVPLRVKAALQLVNLCVREGRPGALLGAGPAPLAVGSEADCLLVVVPLLLIRLLALPFGLPHTKQLLVRAI